MKCNVAVLGASSNPDRYSYKAVEALSEAGYRVFPVHPSGRAVNGLMCYPRLRDIEEPLD
ncbi:MAG: CoA-binding protein, partial [Armatimonadota bacterium]